MISCDDNIISEILRTGEDGLLYHRESQTLEYKEQFNIKGLEDYVKDFAGFANNQGGLIIFGVKDSPREPMGLSEKSKKHFKTIDSEKLSKQLLEDFSPNIEWENREFVVKGKTFGVLAIQESSYKPVIAKRNTTSITDGAIYYRYAGQTKTIKFAELEKIIQSRIKENNLSWIKRVNEIGSSGPSDSAVLGIKQGIEDKNDNQVLLIDEKLIRDINFIREGQFEEKYGAKTLRLMAEILPAHNYLIKEDLMKLYPYSAQELAKSIIKENPNIKISDIWECIKVNELKSNENYSSYVFTNKSKQDDYYNHGKLPSSIPSIYNEKARTFILDKLSIIGK